MLLVRRKGPLVVSLPVKNKQLVSLRPITPLVFISIKIAFWQENLLQPRYLKGREFSSSLTSLNMDFSSINYLAVLVAAVAAFGLGALWYSPILFGKAWQKELGFSDEYLQQGNMGLIFGSSFLMMLIMSFGLAALLQGQVGESSIDWLSGLYHGLLIGVFFVGTSVAINLLYQRKSVKLWAIDALYQIVFLGIIGTILGAWQ
jgi:hypothetical protein